MQDSIEIEDLLKADAFGVDKPLVSVGIPTFNRPTGLRRTLGYICRQTYLNLEIVVSDNASPGSETESVVREFAAQDKRITYFRQPTNIGAMANFRFVLSKTSGDYFMWAADDDEWHVRFIEACLAASSPSCSVMTRFSTKFRARQACEENPVPLLSPDAKTFANVESYLSNMQPSLFYGLHPRRSILFALRGAYFDFYDCYFVLRIILESNFRTIDQNLYSVGVDAPKYEIKYNDPARGSFRYWPFFFHSMVPLIRCQRLSFRERFDLVRRLRETVQNLKLHHEGQRELKGALERSTQ